MGCRTRKAGLIGALALALALVLVVQSVVGAFALGAAGAGQQLDAFGNPLCLNGPDHDGSGGNSTPDHSKVPSCCTFACSMFWPGVAAPTNVGQIAPGLRIAERLASTHPKTTDLNEKRYRPGNPRAPPILV